MSTENRAEYSLNLKDNFSKGMKEAKEHAEGFAHSMEHVIEHLSEIAAVYASFEVLKDSLEEFEKHKEAVASLGQMYQNNAGYIKENIDQLKELAENQEKTTGIHSEDTLAAEQNLMKFRDIKIGYEELIPAVEDFSKATGINAADAANTFGRALENPQHAMRLLQQAGIGPRQIQFIENLQKAGKTAEAQAQIFEALKDKYHGVAKAMFEANPLAQIEQQFKSTKEAIGGLEDELLKELMPAIKETFESVKELVEWMERHRQIVRAVAIGVGVLVSVYILYHTTLKAVALYEEITTGLMTIKNAVMVFAEANAMALAEGYGVLESAQWALNFAMEANPIGAVVIALTFLAAAIVAVVEGYDALKKEYEDDIHKRQEHWADDEKHSIDQLILKYEKLGKTKKEAYSMAVKEEQKSLDNQAILVNIDLEKAKAAQKEYQDRQAKRHSNSRNEAAYNDDGEELDKYQQKILTLDKVANEISTRKAMLNDFKNNPAAHMGKGDATYAPIKDKTDHVSGNKQVIINVSIAKMIGVDKFVGTSKQVVLEAGEQSEKLLLASVNQFQASIDT